MTLLTGISLIVQVKLAAGRLYLDVQLPRMISPSLYFARMLCICGGPPGTSVDRRGEKREKRKGWKLSKWLHSGCVFLYSCNLQSTTRHCQTHFTLRCMENCVILSFVSVHIIQHEKEGLKKYSALASPSTQKSHKSCCVELTHATVILIFSCAKIHFLSLFQQTFHPQKSTEVCTEETF